jgi:hypothetical protein
MKFSALLLALPLLLGGCSSLTTQKDPSVDLSRVKTVFVERRLADDHRVAELITAELNSLGLEATCGPLTMLTGRVDAVITYTDRWEWDFKSYLIELNVRVRDGRNDKLIAEISYYRPSILAKTPERVLHQLLPPLFKNRKIDSKITIAHPRDPDIPDSVRENLPAPGK